MRTEMTLTMLCRALQENCGDRYEACRQVGVSLIFLDQWERDDKAVAEKVQEAERVGTMGLVSAAIKRGVHGVEEDVYYKGLVVGQQTKYSDSLLTTLLKAKRPEFAKDAEAGPQVTVNVANIMPRAENYERWLEMKQATIAPPQTDAEREEALKALTRLMAQPATDDVIDAEYVVVSPLANVL